MKDLLITYALDENNNLTHIANASKMHSYICTECKCKLSVRESKKTPEEKNYRRTHFAHLNHQDKRGFVCTPETVLHNQYKRALATYLNEQLSNQQPFYLNWKCNKCNSESTYNILSDIQFIHLERRLKNCKPDIVLSTKDNEIKAVIEIVVSHYPEKSVLDIYKNNKYFVVIIKLDSADDLDDIDNSFRTKARVFAYNNPNCNYCYHIQTERLLAHSTQVQVSQTSNTTQRLEAINAIKTKNIAEHKFLCPKCKSTILSARTYQKYTEFVCNDEDCNGYLYIPLSNIVMDENGIVDIINDKNLCLDVNIYRIWLTNPNERIKSLFFNL